MWRQEENERQNVERTTEERKERWGIEKNE